MTLTNPLGDREKSGDSGSNSSNGGGSGNNSDNSAFISLGNTSFGFNFDSEEGLNNSPRNSNNSEEGDSDSGNQTAKAKIESSIKADVAREESQKQDAASSSSAPVDTGNAPLNLQNETEKNSAELKPANGR